LKSPLKLLKKDPKRFQTVAVSGEFLYSIKAHVRAACSAFGRESGSWSAGFYCKFIIVGKKWYNVSVNN